MRGRRAGDRGQTTIEYVLVMVFIVMVIILAFDSGKVGDAISSAVDRVEQTLEAE